MIQNIWAVGRNYADHAKELGNQVPAAAENPMIFLKAGSSAVVNGSQFQLPRFSENVNFETEIALQFGADGHFTGITVAIDLTARDLQEKLKSQGHPWTLAKSFRQSCLMGPTLPLKPELDLSQLEFTLHVNGELKQKGHAKDMIHSPEKLRSYVYERFPVVAGDWLLTGTPKGVGPLKSGDVLVAEILGAFGGACKATWTAL